MMGEKGLIAGIKPGTVILDLSTLDPDTSRYWANNIKKRDGYYLDAPVTCAITRGGGTAAAACGELTFLVG